MLWQAFHYAPPAALAVLVCLTTIFWCFWSLRRFVYYALDRFLLGFIGLLAIYQALGLLREFGLVTAFSNRVLNNIVELTIACLYLLAVLIMRLSSEQRLYTDFEVRSARAEPRHLPLEVSARTSSVSETDAADHNASVSMRGQLRHIEQLVPVLTDPAFKLYMYCCARIDPATGCASVDERGLAALQKSRDEISILLKELEGQGVCRRRADGAATITVEAFSPLWGTGLTSEDNHIDSLTALETQLRASVQAERNARVTTV